MFFYGPRYRTDMPESERTLQSIVLAALLAIGGLISLVAGAGYMDDPDISEYVAALDIVAGVLLIVGGIGCLIGRPLFWKICLAALIVEIVAGVGMLTVTIVGGIVLIAISAVFIWWIHTRSIRKWFGV